MKVNTSNLLRDCLMLMLSFLANYSFSQNLTITATSQSDDLCEPNEVMLRGVISDTVGVATLNLELGDGSVISSNRPFIGDNDGNGISDFLVSGDGFEYSIYTVYPQAGIYSVNFNALKDDGTTITESTEIRINEIPDFDFSTTTTQFNTASFSVQFNVTLNQPGSYDYVWQFGDGNTSISPNPSHTYVEYGDYNVSLQLTSPEGCDSTVIKMGYISSSPSILSASFSSTELKGCDAHSITFTDNSYSSTSIVSRQWEIRNTVTNSIAATNTDLQFTEVFNSGIYDITLIVTDENSNADTIIESNYIQVGTPASSISFTLSPSGTNICNNTTITFTNNSVHPSSNVNYFWDYLGNGDMQPADASNNGSFTYSNLDPGTYEVTLYAINDGCTNISSQEVIIMPAAARSNFNVFTEETCENNQTINIVNISSNADMYAWDVTINGVTNSYSTEDIAPITGLNQGDDWQVTLTATNTMNSCTDIYTQQGSITNALSVDFSQIIITNIGNNEYPATYEIDGSNITTDPDISYLWNLGNGKTSELSTITTAYLNPGYYSPQLTIFSEEGCVYTNTYDNLIYVSGIKPNIQVCETGTCFKPNSIITIIDRSIGSSPISNRTWDIENNTYNVMRSIATIDDPTPYQKTIVINTIDYFNDIDITSLQDNPYTLTLSETNTEINSAIDSIRIRPTIPNPTYTINETYNICNNYVFDIDYVYNGGLPPIQEIWSFTDESGVDVLSEGTNNSDIEGFLVQKRDTSYVIDVNLTLRDLNLCDTTVTIYESFEIPAVDRPNAAFEDSITQEFNGCYAEVAFTDISTPTIEPINQWFWNFNDRSFSSEDKSIEQNPTHRYVLPGTYDVEFTAINALECPDAITKRVEIVDMNTIDLLQEDTIYLCKGSSTVLDPFALQRDYFQYTWFKLTDGSIRVESRDRSIEIEPTSSASYYLTAIYNPTGCILSDSVYVHLFESENLVDTEEYCEDVEIQTTLNATTNLLPGQSALYLWSPINQTGPIIEVRDTGIYVVEILISSSQGSICSYMDTAIINKVPKLIPTFIDSTVCFQDDINIECFVNSSKQLIPVQLKIDDSLSAIGTPISNDVLSDYAYTWFDGSSSTSTEITREGTYNLVIERGMCIVEYDIIVRELCDSLICFPSAFIPEGSIEENRNFYGIGRNIEEFELIIYDRLGELIFYTSNLNESWDGNFNNRPMPSGLYPYVYRYTKGRTKEKVEKHGSVALIR